MSLFKKIFKKEAPGPEQPAQASAAAPAKTEPEMPKPKRQTSRAPRVPLSELHRIAFEMVDPPPTNSVKLLNVSTSGIGIVGKSFTTPPAVGSLLAGNMLIDAKKYPVKVKVAHASPTLVGGFYVEGMKELQQALSQYFELEITALGTMKISPQYHKKEADGDAHWIRGDTTDLYYVTNGDQVLRFRLTFLGNHFERSVGQPLAYGHIVQDSDEEDKPSFKGSVLIDTNVKVSPQMVETAIKFLKNIPHLPPSHLEAISGMIRG